MTDTAEKFRMYAKDLERLRALPYANSTEESDAIETLAKEFERYTPLDVIRWESNLSDPYFRVLALDFMKQESGDSPPTVWETTEVDEETLIEGDLIVRGNLENASNLVVLGNLEIEGGYLAVGEYPCCSVAGSMTARNFYANEAETICLNTLTVHSALVVVYNHTVTIANKVIAGTVIASDSHIDAEIDSPNHHENPNYDVFKTTFGIEFDEDGDDFDSHEDVYEQVIRKVLGG